VKRTSKTLYMPMSLATSVAGGLLAGSVFQQIWKHIAANEQTPPDPTDLNRSARSALFAAALQGLVFGLVRGSRPRRRPWLSGRHSRIAPRLSVIVDPE
jgi:uncharacterized protein DUF4235